MTMNFRTLLLLGLILPLGSLSGCILETTSSGPGPGYGNGTSACLSSQYFDVVWQVDNGGATVLPCGSVPASHVELTANTGVVYSVNGFCSGGNWSGLSASGIPAGTFVTTGTLIGDPNGDVLSTAPVPAASQIAIGYCSAAVLPAFGFTISP